MTYRYHVNLFWDDTDQCWIADVPDLKPCSAFGDTPAEALSQVEVAIQGWLESAESNGFDIPPVRYKPAIYALRESA